MNGKQLTFLIDIYTGENIDISSSFKNTLNTLHNFSTLSSRYFHGSWSKISVDFLKLHYETWQARGGLIHIIEWTLFEPWDIYNPWIIKQSVMWKYHRTEYSLHKSNETLSSSSVNPLPALILVLYLKVGHLTMGLRDPATGLGAMRRAFLTLLSCRLCFLAGWLNQFLT